MSAAATTTTCIGCCDNQRSFTRRNVLRGGLLAGVVGVTSTVFSQGVFSQYAYADSATYNGDVLVVLSLRGGFDGLGVVAPVNDAAYQSARPTIKITPAQALQLDSTFGMHPGMAALKPFYDNKTLAFVHDVGQVNPTRSHFEAMDNMERAAPGSALRTGWLDRALGIRQVEGPFQGTQIGGAAMSPGLAGDVNAMSIVNVDGFALSGAHSPDEDTRLKRSLRALLNDTPRAYAAPMTSALSALDTTTALKATGYTPGNGAKYPAGGLSPALRDTARLIKGGAGLQVACIDWGSWDLHVNAGQPGSGPMDANLREVSAALAAFATDLGTTMNKVTVVTMSEFGRRVHENGSGGTDHGHGNLMMVLGGGVNGGKVYGQWRGVSAANLDQGDLPGTTDYRTVLQDILQNRCGAPSGSSVFPGLNSQLLGVTKPA